MSFLHFDASSFDSASDSGLVPGGGTLSTGTPGFGGGGAGSADAVADGLAGVVAVAAGSAEAGALADADAVEEGEGETGSGAEGPQPEATAAVVARAAARIARGMRKPIFIGRADYLICSPAVALTGPCAIVPPAQDGRGGCTAKKRVGGNVMPMRQGPGRGLSNDTLVCRTLVRKMFLCTLLVYAGAGCGPKLTSDPDGGGQRGGSGGGSSCDPAAGGGGGSGGACAAGGADCSVRDFTAGDRHTCVLLQPGTVKCWGSGNVGQLGLGDVFSRGEEPDEMGDHLPAVDLGAAPAVQSIVAGALHTCVLFGDGHVKCWGPNGHGELGLGDAAPRGDGPGQMGHALPTVDLGKGQKATALVGGWGHTCALLSTGHVKCWGFNWKGELGLGDTTSRGDEPGEMGDSLPSVDLGTGQVATALAAGQDHTCALLAGGAVKCWGLDLKGQLGLGDTTSRGDEPGQMGDALPAVDLGTGRTATAIVAGKAHTCALLDDATVKCWGSGEEGQLGLGDTQGRGDDPGEMGDSLSTVPLGAGAVPVALAAGYAHTCALLADATLKCWGSNWDGALGLGDSEHRGDGPGEMGDSLSTVPLGEGRKVTRVRTGSFHTCALLDDGGLRCWGQNQDGQLGQGDSERRGDGPGEMGAALLPIAIASGESATCAPAGGAGGKEECTGLPAGVCPVAAIAAGQAHSCALLAGGAMKCWGANEQGQLGLGDTFPRAEEPGELGNALPVIELGEVPAVAVAARGDHTCALSASGALRCWGESPEGQLGLGDTASRGDKPGEMGAHLPAVDLGTGAEPRALALGWGHACVLLEGGSVKCWGQGHRGQLGLGDTASRGDQPGEMGDLLPAVDLGAGAETSALAAGWAHTCALSAEGAVRCWGYNWNGQLGLGDTDDRGDQPGEMGANLAAVDLGGGQAAIAIAAGWSHTCALLESGYVKCWGDNLEGQLGLGDEASRGDKPGEMGSSLPPVDLGAGEEAVAITAGFAHTCALLQGGRVKCWGWNHEEQLGTGDDLDRGDGPGEMGDSLPTVDLGTGKKAVAIAAGSEHTCALLDDDHVKCWGQNRAGQLGAGDTVNRGHEPAELGDSLPAVELCSCQE